MDRKAMLISDDRRHIPHFRRVAAKAECQVVVASHSEDAGGGRAAERPGVIVVGFMSGEPETGLDTIERLARVDDVRATTSILLLLPEE